MYPVGVNTTTVTASGFLDLFGESSTIKVRVRPLLGPDCHRLRWTATGDPLNDLARTYVGKGEPVSFTLPVTDQDGWEDAAGIAFKDWSYEATTTVLAPDGSERAGWRQVFQPVTADGPAFNLDNVDTVGAGVTTLPPLTYAVAGPPGEDGAPGPALPADQLEQLYTDFGGMGPVYKGRLNGLLYDGSDETDTLNGILATMSAFGGGELELEGLVRCDGQLENPETGGPLSSVAPIRIRGTVVNMPGTTFVSDAGPYPDVPGLDLRYAGRTDAGCATTLGSTIVLNAAATAADRGNIVTGPGIPDYCYVLAVEPGVSWSLSRRARATAAAVELVNFGGRVQSLGYGLLELDHLQFCNKGPASSAPFVLTTATTLRAHDNVYIGHASKVHAACDEDPWVAGGPGQGTALTTALVAGDHYVTLAVDALPVAIRTGRVLTLNGSLSGQTVTTTADVPKGATSIPVTDFVASQAYPVRTGVAFGNAFDSTAEDAYSVPSAAFQGYGSVFTGNHLHRCRRLVFGMYTTSAWVHNNSWMHKCGSNLAKLPSTLTTALVAGAVVNTLAVTALSIAANVGDVVQVSAGPTSQEAVVSVAAAAGATAVTVTPFTANAAYAVGTKVWNTTAGLGFAVESFGDTNAVNQINLTSNRFGMGESPNGVFRGQGASRSSQFYGNDCQDWANEAQFMALYRFDRGATQNLIQRGVGFWLPIVDDWSDANHVQSQTVLDTFSLSRFPGGLWVHNQLTVTDTTATQFKLSDTAGVNLLTIGANATRAGVGVFPLTLKGNSGGTSTAALTLGDNVVDSHAVLTFNPPAGRQAQVQFKRVGVNSWLVYDGSGANLIVRDSVNAVNVMTLVPGAGVASKAQFAGVVRPGADVTASRPTGLNNTTDRGSMFFDLTLKKPIWWSGTTTGWVDATGTAV